ncbi:uncharacterized protein LOC124297343 [Neodiprion virginianus]|uniref:Uncharacterized protein LOC107221946 n=1 Tax=Neodiprion lecontei TaxID=441921 RepID=A0A6J0BPV8_NEOLC|nr:uncharacterized protein LOC107221946 [Neodiprion lecontei]XP_046411376.1 uncharacterized protein LOC124175313 [Neodiprion fabricii]XP_046604221.1 uncharacterized protein LOC124297343 [Neodiprion virginianus]
MEPSRVPGGPAPRLGFLLATLALTMAATGMLCGAIMSDHWEEVSWDKDVIKGLTNITTPTWYLDGQVAMFEPHPGHTHHHLHKQPGFLVPMNGGIWTLCVSLTEEEIRLLGRVGFPQEKCINYLTPDEAHEEIRATWQNRMQNLSISCSLVCLIILSCAAPVGFFGLCRHQISAVLVAGVMYLLAATFALFTLTIIHFKRAQDRGARVLDGPEDGVVGGPVPKDVLKARRFTTSWSLDFGWGGVTLCALASVAWILLSKIMRFSPIAALIA